MKTPNGYTYTKRTDGWMREDAYSGRVDRATGEDDESKHCFGDTIKGKCSLCVHRLGHTMNMHAAKLREEAEHARVEAR